MEAIAIIEKLAEDVEDFTIVNTPGMCPGDQGLIRKFDDADRRYVACARCSADLTEEDDFHADRTGAPVREHEAKVVNAPGVVDYDDGNETEVTVAVDQVKEIEKAIKRASRAAAKLGLDAPTIEVVGKPRFVEQQMHVEDTWEQYCRSFGTGLMVEVVDVKITTPAFNLPGWKIVASLDLDPEGNIVSKAPAYYESDLPAEWNQMGDRCDHCELNRNRKTLVALESVETGEFKIVGKSCLAEYVGYVDAWNLVKLAVQLSKLDLNENGRGSGGAALLAPVRSFVAATVAIVRALGFTPGGETRDQVTGFLFSRKTREKLIEAGVEVDAEADLAKAEELIEWAKGQAGNDYLENLRIAATRAAATSKTYGLLASLPSAYDRAMGKAAERKIRDEAKAASEWVGAVKERREFTGTVVAARQSEGYSYYGPDSLWLKLVTDEGNTLIWKTNTDTASYPLFSAEDRTLAVGSSILGEGDRITGKATVKCHDEYQGEKQTTVTRWKFEIAEKQEEVIGS